MTSEVIDIRICYLHTQGTNKYREVTMKHIWLLPAVFAVAFFLFTIWTIVSTNQPLGFIVEHTHSAWGVQIGIDLLNSLCVGIYLACVVSKDNHFRVWPYVLLTLCLGSTGLLVFVARVLYLRYAAIPTQHSNLPAISGATK